MRRFPERSLEAPAEVGRRHGRAARKGGNVQLLRIRPVDQITHAQQMPGKWHSWAIHLSIIAQRRVLAVRPGTRAPLRDVAPPRPSPGSGAAQARPDRAAATLVARAWSCGAPIRSAMTAKSSAGPVHSSSSTDLLTGALDSAVAMRRKSTALSNWS